MFIANKSKILIAFCSLLLALQVSAYEKNVVKSVNFKLYYNNGGQNIAKNLITYAENNLGYIENFLGTRLVEKIDIFLMESNETENAQFNLNNGTIILTNKAIKINYRGNIIEAYFQLKKQLAEILIYDMLYGNTIKDRLKNNREVNIQDWFIKGLSLFVAQKKESDMGVLADYFEKRLKLNFNLTSNKETEEIGFSIVKFLNDTFGTGKLKQILFYSRLSGNTDFSFKIVLNKSTDKLISKWFYTERENYFKKSKMRLPNEPEFLPKKLKSANIIDLKFNDDGKSLDILIKSEDGVELYNYNFENMNTKKVFGLNTIHQNLVFCFVQSQNSYLITKSDGVSSKLYLIKNGKLRDTKTLDFSNIYKVSVLKNGNYILLTQKNFITDLYSLKNLNDKNLINLSNSKWEITDFSIANENSIFISSINNNKYQIIQLENSNVIYSSTHEISELSAYRDSFLSFLSFESGINSGMIVNRYDTAKYYRVTNYNRSISVYDFSFNLQKVAEVINYDKKNYVVISDATTKDIYNIIKDTTNNSIDSTNNIQNIISDSIDNGIYFFTDFEYKKIEIPKPETKFYLKQNIQIKLKEFKSDKLEFKPWYMKISYSNETFNSSEFAYFFPIEQGLYNGANLILGCGIVDIFKNFTFEGNLRQPLRNKGLDIDFSAIKNEKNGYSGLKFFNNNYQKEIYNYSDKFVSWQLKYFNLKKLNHKTVNIVSAGVRRDLNIKTSISEENIKKSDLKIFQTFVENHLIIEFYKLSKINFKNSFKTDLYFAINKPISKTGFNNIFKIKIEQNFIFYRVLKLSANLITCISPAHQKTVFLLGGQSNWVKPVMTFSNLHDSSHTLMYSSVEDFEGFPLNYLSGTSYSLFKLKFILPLNPVLHYHSFNQNVFKYLSIKAIFNTGTAWYGKNPFSITNPENKTITETGSMTITNYTYKNPLLWSWCSGISSVILGYNFGIDWSQGYNELGKQNSLIGFTIGKGF